MFSKYLYIIAILNSIVAHAMVYRDGQAYHFLNGDVCQEGSTPEAQEYDLDDRTCLDASQVTSINIHRARRKTCSYWSEESDCLGNTVTVEHSIKGGCYDIVKPGEDTTPKYKSMRYTLGACKEAVRMSPL